jgi:hypothetical protein
VLQKHGESRGPSGVIISDESNDAPARRIRTSEPAPVYASAGIEASEDRGDEWAGREEGYNGGGESKGDIALPVRISFSRDDELDGNYMEVEAETEAVESESRLDSSPHISHDESKRDDDLPVDPISTAVDHDAVDGSTNATLLSSSTNPHGVFAFEIPIRRSPRSAKMRKLYEERRAAMRERSMMEVSRSKVASEGSSFMEDGINEGNLSARGNSDGYRRSVSRKEEGGGNSLKASTPEPSYTSAPTPQHHHQPAVSGPPLRTPRDIPQPSAKVYKKPTAPSNYKLLVNAINLVCLAGSHRAVEREGVLEVMGLTPKDTFFILFRNSQTLHYSGLYRKDADSLRVLKVHGLGPAEVTDDMIETFFKYESSAKKFSPMLTKEFTLTTDGIALKPNFNRKPKRSY